MQLNGLLFPAPPCSYTKKSQNLIWIPSNPIHTPAYQLKALCQKNRLHQTMNMEAKNKNTNSSIFSSPLSPFLRCLCLQQTDSDVDENIYQTKNTTENLKHEKRSHSSLNCSTLITPTIRSVQESNIQQNRIAQDALTPPRRIHKMSSFQIMSNDTLENSKCESHASSKTIRLSEKKKILKPNHGGEPEVKISSKQQSIQQNINNYLSQNRSKTRREECKTPDNPQIQHNHNQDHSRQHHCSHQGFQSISKTSKFEGKSKKANVQKRKKLSNNSETINGDDQLRNTHRNLSSFQSETKLKRADIQKKQQQKDQQLIQNSKNSLIDLTISGDHLLDSCYPHDRQSHIQSFFSSSSSSQSPSSNLVDHSLLDHTSTYLPSNSFSNRSISPLTHTSSSINTTSSSIKTYTKPTIPSLQRAVKLGPNLENVYSTSIPCLYLPAKSGSDKILVYFHGNAEDLGHSYEFASSLRQYLSVNVLVGEYPGYGLYKGQPNHDQILADADSIYEFIRKALNVPSKDIIIFGRSIGSGPACYIAGTRNIGGLILMCPYTSIRSVVKNIAGSILSLLVAERFRNIDCIKGVKAPTLFIHGKQDELVPYYHSLKLMECIQHISYIHLPSEMTHNDFDFMKDMIEPTKDFFCQANISIDRKQTIKVPTIYNTCTTK